jgi:hypothetical protein
VVFIPSTVHGTVGVSGAAALNAVVSRPDGSRIAYVTTKSPGAAAQYDVTVGAPSSALRARVHDEAANPLPPIPEPTARAMAESALRAQTQSPNPSIRSTAQLVEGLAAIVLGTSDPGAGST